MTENTGFCAACGHPGIRSESHICSECGGPDRTVLVCKQCKSRWELGREVRPFLSEYFNRSIPSDRGVTISIDGCDKCSDEKNANVKIFSINDSTVH